MVWLLCFALLLTIKREIDLTKWVRGGSEIHGMLCVITGSTTHRHLAPRLSWPHHVSL